MQFKFNFEGKEYAVEIQESETETKIKIGDKIIVFKKEEEGAAESKTVIPSISLPQKDFSEKEIKAPITGIISEIFIKTNEHIKRGQKLLTIFSMKMENEIQSEFEGEIKEIRVEKNKTVKNGDVLIILK